MSFLPTPGGKLHAGCQCWAGFSEKHEEITDYYRNKGL
jgi:hypothetical protein